MKTEVQQFEHHAARAFFASAWADYVEEKGEALHGEIMRQMPQEVDPSAIHAARTLSMDIVTANRGSIAQLMRYIEITGDGDRPNTIEYFGHYAAMQAMGHGVGLGDAFGDAVREKITIPYIEFGSYSLSKDY